MISDTGFSVASVFWIVFSLGVFYLSSLLWKHYRNNPVLHPLLLTTIVISLLLLFTSTNADAFQQHTQLLDWLLGPAIVALALPVYRQIIVIKTLGYRCLLPIAIGGITAPVLAWFSVYYTSDSLSLQMTVWVKSITTPLAMDVTAIIGGIPELAAVIVIITGIVGAISAPIIFSLFHINSQAAQGIAMGTIAHAIGTSTANYMGDKVAALATLSLCLNGICTALILPVLF